MKVIYPDKVNSISATEEDSDYPVSNLYDQHATSVWKAESKDASITVQVQATSNAIAIFRTNATTANLRFSSGSNIIWEAGTRWGANEAWDYSHTLITDSYSPTFISQWIDYTEIAGAVDVVIDLVSPNGTVLEVGAIKAGYAYSFNDPRYGFSENRRTTSVINDLGYGYKYIKNKVQNIREFSGGLFITRDSDFYTFMNLIKMQGGSEPLAWRLVDSLSNQDWVVLAYISQLSGNHDYRLYNNLSWSLIEAI